MRQKRTGTIAINLCAKPKHTHAYKQRCHLCDVWYEPTMQNLKLHQHPLATHIQKRRRHAQHTH